MQKCQESLQQYKISLVKQNTKLFLITSKQAATAADSSEGKDVKLIWTGFMKGTRNEDIHFHSQVTEKTIKPAVWEENTARAVLNPALLGLLKTS